MLATRLISGVAKGRGYVLNEDTEEKVVVDGVAVVGVHC